MKIFSDEERKYFGNEGISNAQVEIIENAIERSMNKAIEQALLMMPKALAGLLKGMNNMKKISEGYFSNPANADLKDHDDRMREILADLEGKHPEWLPEKLLEESGKSMRKEINMGATIGSIDASPNVGGLLNDIETSKG